MPVSYKDRRYSWLGANEYSCKGQGAGKHANRTLPPGGVLHELIRKINILPFIQSKSVIVELNLSIKLPYGCKYSEYNIIMPQLKA